MAVRVVGGADSAQAKSVKPEPPQSASSCVANPLGQKSGRVR